MLQNFTFSSPKQIYFFLMSKSFSWKLSRHKQLWGSIKYAWNWSRSQWPQSWLGDKQSHLIAAILCFGHIHFINRQNKNYIQWPLRDKSQENMSTTSFLYVLTVMRFLRYRKFAKRDQITVPSKSLFFLKWKTRYY